MIDAIEIFYTTITILYSESKKHKKELEESHKNSIDSESKNPSGNQRFIHQVQQFKVKKEESNSTLDESSGNLLKKHETDKLSFNKKKNNGFGLRSFFWEKQMIAQVMDTETAQKLGYEREADFQRSRNIILGN